jgi:hypothetical protein
LQQVIAKFRSIEAVDPTTLAVYPDRLVLTHGERSGRVVPLEDVSRVRVRTLFGVSTVLIRTAGGETVVADLFARSEAESARALLEELLAPAGGREPAAAEAVPAA